MKKVILFVVIIALFIACQQKGPARYSTSGTEITLMKKLVDDYEKGDWNAWLSAYADDASIFHNTETDSVDAEAALERHRETLGLMSSYHFKDEPIFFEKIIDDEGDTWVNFWGYWRATLNANEKKINTAVHLSVKIEDGKIVEEHGFWDNSPMVLALQEIEAEAAKKALEEGAEE